MGRIAWAAAFGGAVALTLLASLPAAAQFVCNTTSTDSTCTNSGTSGAFSLNPGAGNATTTNTGTVAGTLLTQTNTGGNAATTNSGNVSQLLRASTTAGGSATATNSGSVGAALQAVTQGGGDAVATNSGSVATTMTASTFGGGNATATNSGNVGQGVLVETDAGGNATGTNSGSIGQSFGVDAIQGNATGTNSGSISQNFSVNTAAGGNAAGTNSGSIGHSFGVATTGGGDASGTNSGSIGQTFTVGTSAGGNAIATNSGVIGQSMFANTNAGGNASAINSGSIGGIFQVETQTGGNATAINTGTVNGRIVVAALGGGTESLTNSGTIGGNSGGTAILFAGGPDTLNLLAGSTIVGNIQLVGTNDTVNFISGNHNLTFNTLAGATVGGAIPFAVSGNQAAAVDPTPFGLADRNLMDFTRGVSSILGSLGGASAAPNGPISSAFAPSDTVAARVDDAFASLGGIPALAYAGDAMVFKNPTMVDQYGRSVWARGFGGEHIQDADGPLLRSTTVFIGGAVGFDFVARPDLRLGAFVGGGQSRLALDLNQGHTDTDTVFGGLYGRWGFVSFGAPSFLDFALHGGGSSNSTARTVNNNVLPTGVEIATAKYDSSYVSPEIKYGVNLPLGSEYTLTPSLQVRYVAGFFGGYTEAGTTAPLTVASRTISDFEERGELKLTRATPIGQDLLLASIHVGALGLERVGDTTVNTVLLGANLPFVTPGKSTVAGVLGGGGLEWRTREGVSIYGAAEAIGFSDQGTVVSARGGLRVAF